MQFSFEDIDRARRLLGLDEEATLEEIRSAFKRLARSVHPDTCKQERQVCEEKYKELSSAYNLLIKYCENYRYSFKEKEVARQKWDREAYKHLKQFYDGWWGNI